MDIKMLQDYKEWLTRSPEDILAAVVRHGGWGAVFTSAKFGAKRLPVWAHRVRNYFNREPRFLMRLSADWSYNWLTYVYKKPVERSGEGTIAKFKRENALTDYVYRDEENTNWFQMSPGGAIYHFKEIGNETLEGIHQEWMGQGGTPIFKLVSPDGTGGSMETIIDNPLRVGRRVQALMPKASRGFVIGDVNVPMPVARPIVKIERYQGSYNYAETVDLGNEDHDRLDVQPHTNKEYAKYGGYENPEDRFSKLKFRRFPERDRKGNLLAEQV